MAQRGPTEIRLSAWSPHEHWVPEVKSLRTARARKDWRGRGRGPDRTCIRPEQGNERRFALCLADFLKTHRPNGFAENPATKKRARVPAHTHACMRAGEKKESWLGVSESPSRSVPLVPRTGTKILRDIHLVSPPCRRETERCRRNDAYLREGGFGALGVASISTAWVWVHPGVWRAPEPYAWHSLGDLHLVYPAGLLTLG